MHDLVDVFGFSYRVCCDGHCLIVSLLQFSFKHQEPCKHVCTKKYSTTKAEDKANLDFLKKGMLLNYQHHW